MTDERHLCSRMRSHLSLAREPETYDAWAARAIEAYEKRNDPKPELTEWDKAFYAFLCLDYDVLDDPDKKAFDEWIRARDDRLLWRWSYTWTPDGPKNFVAQRARSFEGGKITFMGKPSSIGQFVGESWSDLRRLIEVTEERSKGP